MAREAYKLNEKLQLLVTCTQIGREVGITAKAASLRLKNAAVFPDDKGFFKLADIMPVFAPGGARYSSEQERLAAVKADREGLKLETERAELIHSEDMRRTIYLALEPVTELLEMLPQILERDCGISGDAAEKAEKLCAGAREKCVADLLAAAEGETVEREAKNAAEKAA